MAYNCILDLIGQTPLLKLNRISENGKAAIYAKLEMFNPGGSIKDRVGLHMIETAEKDGTLKPGMTIVEPTSGNTGIGLAMVAAVKGYKMILVMPDTMSRERRILMQAYGAEIILTPGAQGMLGSVNKAKEMAANDPSIFIPQQFENPANPEAHSLTTAREILQQMNGEIDYFVATVGTGGTLTGIAKVLHTELPKAKIIAVEPAESPVLSGGKPGPHKIQGIGAGFIPGVLDIKLIDEIVKIKSEEAIETTRLLAKQEGILAGISAGAAVAGAKHIARIAKPDERIVTILPDTGERYLSSEVF